MVTIAKTSESNVVAQASAAREVLKLNAGECVRNITLDGATTAKSEYGEFMALNFTTEDGEHLSFICAPTTVWGRNCISTFADAIDIGDGHTYTLKADFIGKKVWVGKSMPIVSTQKKNKTYMQLEWGYET